MERHIRYTLMFQRESSTLQIGLRTHFGHEDDIIFTSPLKEISANFTLCLQKINSYIHVKLCLDSVEADTFDTPLHVYVEGGQKY